jgi:hypothetical protein
MSVERSWQQVAAQLQGAIVAIPRPNFDAITNPKEMGKKLKRLCKDLKENMKEAMSEIREMPFHVYSLLKELVERIGDLIARFFKYISEKVKSFVEWVTGILNNVKAKFRHSD